jgi:hypothetical protein
MRLKQQHLKKFGSFLQFEKKNENRKIIPIWQMSILCRPKDPERTLSLALVAVLVSDVNVIKTLFSSSMTVPLNELKCLSFANLSSQV